MLSATIHCPVEGPDEIHTDFKAWLRAVQNELHVALGYRHNRGYTQRKTRHHSAFSLTGEGFADAVAEINEYKPPPESSGHEGLRLSLLTTLGADLRPFEAGFMLFAWEIHTYAQRRADGGVLKLGFDHAEPKPMAHCWRLLYILQPHEPQRLITSPPEPPRPPQPET